MGINYENVKALLSARRHNIKFFNRAFFNAYMKACSIARRNAENEVDDSYTDEEGIVRYHSFDEVYSSDLYNRNSGTYCEFLSVISGLLAKVGD